MKAFFKNCFIFSLFSLMLIYHVNCSGFRAPTAAPEFNCSAYYTYIVQELTDTYSSTAMKDKTSNIVAVTTDISNYSYYEISTTVTTSQQITNLDAGNPRQVYFIGPDTDRQASILGGARFYAILPQSFFYYTNTTGMAGNYYCTENWLYSVRNDYSFTFTNNVSNLSFQCTANVVDSLVLFDQILYFALDCPEPPQAGRYQLYIQTTIYSGQYFLGAAGVTSTTVLQGVQSNWENPDAVTVNFDQENTPYITSINPVEGDPGISLNVTGVTDVNSTINITSTILLNANLPPTYACALPSTPTALVYNQQSSYSCQTVSNTPGGLYNYSQQTNRGYAYNLPQTSYYNFDQQLSYNVAVHPIVQSVSPTVGFSQGQILTVTGQGFNPNISQINASYAGIACNIQTVSSNSLTCQLSPVNLTTAILSGSTFGSSGLTLETFQGYSKSLTALALDNTTSPTSSNIVQTPETLYTTQSGFFQRFTSYFIAPLNGTYRFSVAANTETIVYIASSGTTNNIVNGLSGIQSNRASLVSIANNSQSTIYRDFANALNLSTSLSSNVSLVEGQAYLLTVVQDSTLPNTYMTLAVEIPTQVEGANSIATVQNIQINYNYPPATEWRSFCEEFTTPFTWEGNIFVGNISFALFEMQINTSLSNPLTASLTSAGSYAATSLYDPNNPNVVALSEELTRLNGGRRINVTKFPVTFGNYNGFSCALIGSNIPGNQPLSSTLGQLGWGFNITFLDPMPYWWYNTAGNYVELFTSANLSVLATNLGIKQGVVNNLETLALQGNYFPSYIVTAESLSYYKTLTYYGGYNGSQIVQGTWNFTFNGCNSGNLSYNIDGSTLANVFRSQFGLFVTVMTSGLAESGYNWQISFDSYNGDAPLLTANGAGLYVLNGNAQSNPITITTNKTQIGRTNVFLAPVPTEFFRVPISNPEIVVYSGGVRSHTASGANTTLTIIQSPTVTGAFLNTNNITINFTVSYPTSSPIPSNIASLTIVVDGNNCTVTQLYSGGFSCNLPQGTPVLTPGPLNVSVYWPAYGYYATSSPLLLTEGPSATVTGVSPTSVSQSGGTTITVTGTGFGNPSNTVVTLNGISAQIVSVTSTQIVFISPNLTSTGAPGSTAIDIVTNTISLVANGLSTYQTTAATIVSLNVTSITPVDTSYIKGTLSNNPDTTISDYTAALVSSDGSGNPKIPVYIFVLNATSFIGAVAGGLPGTYQFVLTHATLGNSHQTPTVLVQILVSSVSPTSGSYLGGTQLTITGVNFSPVLNENQVYVGGEVNDAICTVTSATTTKLTCELGGLQGNQVIGTAYQVTVYGRLQQEASYTSNFTFTFVDTSAAVLSANSSIAITGEVIELYGKGFTSNNGSAVIVYLDDTSCVTTFVNDSILLFTVPELTTSIYAVSAFVPNIGYIDNSGVAVLVPVVIYGINYPVANAQGNRLVITGNGFSGPNVTLLQTGTTCNIISATTTQIVCDLVATFKNTSLYFLSVSFDESEPELLEILVNVTQTPVVSSISATTSGVTTTVTVNGHNFTQFGGIVYLLLTLDGSEIVATASSVTNSSFVAQFTNLAAGSYSVDVLFEGVGYASIGSGANTVTVALQTPASHPAQIGFGGISSLTYTGNGFNNVTTDNDVRVCGLATTVTSSTSSSITFNVPPIVTPTSQSAYSLVQNGQVLAPNTFGSNLTGTYSVINDGNILTAYYDSSPSCQVGLDFGAGTYVAIDSITVYPDITLSNPALLAGATILAGNTTSSYSTLITLNNTVQVGSNTFTLSGQNYYRYVVFSGANCRIAELQVNGIQYAANSQNLSNTACNLDFYIDGSLAVSLPNEFSVSQSHTLVVTEVSPTQGPSAGGTQITISGTNFGNDSTKLSVLVNSVSCVGLSVNAAGTQITCTTGYAASYPTVTSFTVQHSAYGLAVINTTVFSYVDRWSNYSTWGQLPPPSTGDIVYVPAGQRLLFDAAGPVNVVGFEIEGEIIFEDARDYQITANWILIVGGLFQIGTAAQPFQHKVQITLVGETQDVQIPTYGNKVFGVRGGTVSIYGLPKTTWTTLTTTAGVNATQITVVDSTGWNVGDSIVIASTDFEDDHYDTANIIAIAGNVITLNTPLTYSHYSQVEIYPTGPVTIAAEVGSLTRNIVIQGDSISDEYNYGAHVLISQYGSPSVVVFQYVEFYRVGQRGQKNRFPINFVQIYDAPDSAVIGCAIHSSYNRGVRVLQSNYIEFQNNVLFNIIGHGFYLESSTETFNNFERNLVLGIQINYFFQTTDLTPAAFYITNPQNFFSNNVAGGSEYYGFAFSVQNGLKNANTYVNLANVCPQGAPLGLFTNNIAHSNVQEGLWIWPTYTPLTNPCGPNDWTTNPAVTATFSGFLAYKHASVAIFLYSIGDVRFQNLVLIDNANEGFFVNYAGNSPDNTSQINNSLIIGYSQGNAQGKYNSKGISVPASENFVVSNITFVNFNETTMAALTTCTGYCYDGQAHTVRVFNLSFVNVANRLLWRIGAIFLTEDTSLSGTVGWSVPYQIHNLVEPSCVVDPVLENTITCDNSVIVRRIELYQISSPFAIWEQTLRVLRLEGLESYLSANTTNYTDVFYDYTIGGFVAPYVLGFRYHVFFSNGSDFNRTVVQIESSRYQQTDPTVILEFNHTDPRELYDIYIGGQLSPQFPNGTVMLVSESGLLMGNYTHDQNTSLLSVAINYADYQGLADIRAVICLWTCPPPPAAIQTDGVIRYWSNASDWATTGTVPVDGDSVVIPSTWFMYLDTDTANLASLQINGILQVLDPVNGGPASASINAYNIWIYSGILSAGSQDSPYTGNFAINLLGDQTNPYLIMDATADSGPKVFAVTGNLSLYGQPLAATQTSLASPASASSSTIQLVNAASLGLVPGDTLVIGPTDFSVDEVEVVQVAVVSGNTVFLAAPLQYNHFGGSSVPTSNSELNLNLSAQVGKLNRNIQINGGNASWGGRLYVTESTVIEFDASTNGFVLHTFAGTVNLSYVEFINFGQDSGQGGIHFDTVVTYPSYISGISWHSGDGWGVHFYQSSGIIIDSSVIVYPLQYGIFVDGGNNNEITNNLIAGTYNTGNINGDVIDLIASVYSTSETTFISGNTVAGSEGIGFLFVADVCGANPAQNGPNSANSVQTGVIVTVPDSSTCIQIQNIQVFHANNGGINTYAAVQELQAQNLVLTDNAQGSLNLNLGGLGDIPLASITLSNSYIGGTTFKTLQNSYNCSNVSGIRIPVATLQANAIPFITWQQPYWSVYDEALFVTTFNVEKVEIANFADATCAGLFAFETNPYAADASALTTLNSLTTTNVNADNFVNFASPNPSWITDLICGNIQCTGLYNVLIKDETGLFGNAPGSYIPNVPGIINSNSNTSVAYTSTNYGILSFDSLDSDNFTRLFSPITITSYVGAPNYDNTLNSFQDHQYLNTIWSNKTVFQGVQRLSRFEALLPDSASYNLVFTGTHPSTTRYELLGSSNYVIVKTSYETPLLVTVSTPAGTVNPNILQLGQGVNLASQSQLCGVNNYYTDGTIEFLLNGNSDCVVILQTQNSLYVTIRYQTTVSQFFSSNGPATFIDQLAALVGVPSYDVRVVDVVVGSAIVQTYIPVANSQTAQAYANTIISGVNNGALDMPGMKVLDMTYSIYTTESVADGSTGSTSVTRVNPILSSTDIALIVVGALAFIFSVTVGVVVYRRIKRRMKDKKPKKGEFLSENNYSPESSDRCVIKDVENENMFKVSDLQMNNLDDLQMNNLGDLQINNLGVDNVSPPVSNEESSPETFMKPRNKRHGSIDLAPRRISLALNDSFSSNHELAKRNSDEEKINDSNIVAENFLKDLKQYETSQSNSESNSPLFKGIKKRLSVAADKLGEPKRKSQFGLSISTTERRFSTLKRVVDPEQKRSSIFLTNDQANNDLIKANTKNKEMNIQDLESPAQFLFRS